MAWRASPVANEWIRKWAPIERTSRRRNRRRHGGTSRNTPKASVSKPGVSNRVPATRINSASNSESVGIRPAASSSRIRWHVRQPCATGEQRAGDARRDHRRQGEPGTGQLASQSRKAELRQRQNDEQYEQPGKHGEDSRRNGRGGNYPHHSRWPGAVRLSLRRTPTFRGSASESGAMANGSGRASWRLKEPPQDDWSRRRNRRGRQSPSRSAGLERAAPTEPRRRAAAGMAPDVARPPRRSIRCRGPPSRSSSASSGRRTNPPASRTCYERRAPEAPPEASAHPRETTAVGRHARTPPDRRRPSGQSCATRPPTQLGRRSTRPVVSANSTGQPSKAV